MHGTIGKRGLKTDIYIYIYIYNFCQNESCEKASRILSKFTEKKKAKYFSEPQSGVLIC